MLLIQIDGLSREQVEKAIKKGKMPFLQHLQTVQGYSLSTFYPGLPSTTPAVQAELYYGVKTAVPAFSFREQPGGKIVSMFDSEVVKKYEATFSAKTEGLLRGGSTWSNIYSGGAAAEETHFCISSIGWRELWRGRHLLNLLIFFLLQIPAVLRISGLMVLESIIGLCDAVAGILRGRHVWLELGVILSRMCVGVGLREVVTIGGKIDLARGLPIIHINFLGYDELSHRRGPTSPFAHWSLPGIDRAIRDLYRAAHRSHRRDYQVWVFSDHGQQEATFYTKETGENLDHVIARLLEEETNATGISSPEKKGQSDKPPFSRAAMGPVGHLYLRDLTEDIRKTALARKLVAEAKVPGVVQRTQDGVIRWFHVQGETIVPDEVPGRLPDHPDYLRQEIAEDLADLARQENSGDLILLGWDPTGRSLTFAPERGSHAGFSPAETQGFLLLPPDSPLAKSSRKYVRPSKMREAAMDLLEREPMASEDQPEGSFPSALRVMSYNVHSCIGMDGRVSPRRIARVIAQQNPDVVALQELEHGRSRSRGEDQAAAIAESLGYYMVFCPTVVRQAERYGHAVLSRYPMEALKVGELPSPGAKWWPEPRGALWCRMLVDGTPTNIVTTHFGLSSLERLAQMQALLGPDWLGPILEDEPVIICGDLNCTPDSPPLRLAARFLKDAASVHPFPLRTFASNYPLLRLDHILVSEHLAVEQTSVIRNDLTRVASDHLPIVTSLKLETKKLQFLTN